MAKIIDLTQSDGDLIILGRALVLPESATDSQPNPLDGSLRFNPQIGAAQLFVGGFWHTLGGEGSGTGGSGGGGGGAVNNHTHTISQIVGLQNILNGKAPVSHNHTIGDITGLTAALSNKAERDHSHAIGDVTGLSGELSSKSLVGHAHSYAPSASIAGCLPASPPSGYSMSYVANKAMTIPSNFVGSRLAAKTVPTNTYAITLTKGSTTVGTFIIYPSGTTVLTSVGGNITLAAGDMLTFTCPPRDAGINTISFNIFATTAAESTGASLT